MERKCVYVAQDAALLTIYMSLDERKPLDYLRAIAYRMPNPE
jgi:hypothetical protein